MCIEPNEGDKNLSVVADWLFGYEEELHKKRLGVIALPYEDSLMSRLNYYVDSRIFTSKFNFGQSKYVAKPYERVSYMWDYNYQWEFRHILIRGNSMLSLTYVNPKDREHKAIVSFNLSKLLKSYNLT